MYVSPLLCSVRVLAHSNVLICTPIKVTADGKYTSTQTPQMVYLTMVLIRMLIVLGTGNDLAMAATIATRYSAVRRQTANSKG